LVRASTPRVSVAVSTYRRSDRALRLLESLAHQTLPADEFEVVVYDDASGDGTAEALEARRDQVPYPLKVVRGERNVGPASGCNRAWRATTGRIVAFTDDDCVPDPGWLREGLRCFDDPSIDVVVGRVEPAPDQLGDLGPFSRTLRVNDARFFATANCFYRRAALETAGGFDEQFRRAAGEDTDLGLRVLGDNGPAHFALLALVHHDVRPSDFGAAAREAWSKWVDLALVVRKHPEIRQTLLYRRVFWKKSHALWLLAAAGAVAATRQPWAGFALVPYLHHRLVSRPLALGIRGITSVPGAAALDGLEVACMLRSSWRYRCFIL
jgi:GT2 family glycosyltransferase